MDNENKIFDIWKIGGWLFLVFFTIWLFVYLIIPPTFSDTDITFFKDAGNNYALGSGLVTRIGPANSLIEDRFYANYPPLFPLFYGLFAKLFGVGPKVSRIFDLFLASLASFAFWITIKPRFSNRSIFIPSLFLLVLLLLTLPAGPFGGERERPDNVSFAIMVASWAIAHSVLKYRIFISGLLLGINGLISPFGFTINYLGLILIIIIDNYTQKKDKALLHTLYVLIIDIFSAAIPIILGIIAIMFYDSSFFARFVGHASGKTIGGKGALGYFIALLSGDYNLYLQAFSSYSSFAGKIKLLYLIFTIIVICCFLSISAIRHKRQNRLLMIAIIFIFLVTITLFPYQVNYMLFVLAAIIVLFGSLTEIQSMSTIVAQRWIILICVFFSTIYIIPYEIRELVVARQSGPSFYRMQSVLEKYSKSNTKKPLLVATHATNYYIFKGKTFDIVNLECIAGTTNLSQVDIFALSFVGSRNPLKPMYPYYWNPSEYKLIYRPSLPQQTTIFGYPVSNSSNTWEMELYIRKSN